MGHENYIIEEHDWERKENNLVEIEGETFINDVSIFNNSILNPEYLGSSYAYNTSTLLNFNGLQEFLLQENNRIVSEDNTYLKIYLDYQNNNDFILQSDYFILDFYDYDIAQNKKEFIFSYLGYLESDSLVVPFGNVIQRYVNGESNYGSGILLEMDPGTFNFNKIILDTLQTRQSLIDLYYFE